MKKYFFFILMGLCFFIVPKAHAAIIVDRNTTSSCVTCSSLSFSHVVTSTGTNLFLMVGFAAWDQAGDVTPAASSVTYGGVAMTLATSVVNTGDALNKEFQYYLVNPPAGPNSLIITMQGANASIIAGATSFTGVNQSTPLRASAATSSASTVDQSVTVPSAVNDLVIDTICSGSSITAPSSTQTQEFLYDVDGSTGCNNIGGSTKAGAASVTMEWTLQGDETDILASSIEPALTALTNTSGYAWGNKTGWINFGTSLGGLEVYSTTVQGYAWSQNFGWINFGPLASSSGVVNDGDGNLSGYAWGRDLGYVDFSGVTIDSNGVFHGVASGTIAGSIQFDSSGGCTYCNVSTTWTPNVGASLTVSSVEIDGTNPSTITLTAATTTNVNVEAAITDSTCSLITGGTTTILLYRSGVGSSTCFTAANNLDCYVATAFTASSTCSAGTINTTTTFPVQYFAQATDASSSDPNQNWIATVIFNDSSHTTSDADSTHATSSNVISTLTAINITTSSVNYGKVAASSTTGSVNQTTTIQNAGNSSTTLQLSGTALVHGTETIATSSQVYSTSTFTYAGTSTALTASPVAVSGFKLTSPTSTTNVQSPIYWGLAVPNGSATGTYSGANTFTAVFSN